MENMHLPNSKGDIDYDLIEHKSTALCVLEDNLKAAKGTDGEEAARKALMDAIHELNALLAKKDMDKPYEWIDPGD
jgi:hypothetical protein